MKLKDLDLGDLVVPALDSSFYGLRLRYPKQSPQHLGVVVETSSKKCRVLFPAENLSLWMSCDEVQGFTVTESEEFQNIFQNLDQKESFSDLDCLMLIHRLTRDFKVKTFSGFELGDSLKEVWNTPDFMHLGVPDYQGKCIYLGITVPEVYIDAILKLKSAFKKSLLQLRIIPSSMSKIELSFFFKKEGASFLGAQEDLLSRN
jgi:hypothetical protein